MFKINVQLLNEWDRSINRILTSILFFLNLKSNIYLFERNPNRKLCWLCTYMLYQPGSLHSVSALVMFRLSRGEGCAASVYLTVSPPTGCLIYVLEKVIF